MKEEYDSNKPFPSSLRDVLPEILQFIPPLQGKIIASHLRVVSKSFLGVYNRVLQKQKQQISYSEREAAFIKQELEIQYLLEHEGDILDNFTSLIARYKVNKVFSQLKASMQNATSEDTFAFLKREDLLDEINKTIIWANIRNKAGKCSNCHLTRLPASVFKEPKWSFYRFLETVLISFSLLFTFAASIPAVVSAMTFSHLCLFSVSFLIGVAWNKRYFEAHYLLQEATHLNLKNNRLQTLPPEIAKLKKLQELDLDANGLIALPPEIGELKDLQTLRVDSNQLKSLPKELYQLHALNKLFLGNNQLSVVTAEMANFPNLVELDLTQNGLESVPQEIGQSSTLSVLGLEKNNLSEVPYTVREEILYNFVRTKEEEIKTKTSMVQVLLSQKPKLQI